MLELKAVLFTLQSLAKLKSHMHIRVMSDNTTTVASINKQGSTQSGPCNAMARAIWDFVNPRNIWISAAHCPGVLNCEADAASRKFQDETEWELNQNIFEKLCEKFGQPDVDLFASRVNHKVDTYCAWKPDPAAVFIDASLFDWGALCIWVPSFLNCTFDVTKIYSGSGRRNLDCAFLAY